MTVFSPLENPLSKDGLFRQAFPGEGFLDKIHIPFQNGMAAMALSVPPLPSFLKKRPG